MAAIRDRTKGSRYDYIAEDEPLSVAQQHLYELLKKQLSTRKVSLEGTLQQSHEFTPAVVFKPLASEVEGLHSLEEYQAKKEEHSHLDQLRELGLSSEEIELKLSCEKTESLGPSPAKRKRLSVEPAAQQQRLAALHQKITNREELLRRPLTFTGVHRMSRHAMEVEKSLFRHLDNPLTHLTVQDSQPHVVYPSRVIPSTSTHAREEEEECTTQEEASSSPPEKVAMATPLPPQVIQRNRLSVAEIKAIPKFSNYSPGDPNKVLYVKNLHSSIKKEDLVAVFTAAGSVSAPTIRLMSGRMRGQAFVEFSCAGDAVTALELVNGYEIKGKPLVISYGNRR